MRSKATTWPKLGIECIYAEIMRTLPFCNGCIEKICAEVTRRICGDSLRLRPISAIKTFYVCRRWRFCSPDCSVLLCKSYVEIGGYAAQAPPVAA